MFEIIVAIGNNLIPILGSVLCVALVLKWIAFRSGRRELQFMSHVTGELDKRLESAEHRPLKDPHDIERFVFNILDDVKEALPDRGLRGGNNYQTSPRHNKQSLTSFASGKMTTIHSIKSQIDIFKSATAPYFPEVTKRILKNNPNWNRLLGFLPIEPIIKLIDILPNLFIVGGIFGTFLGITSALPLISQIDLNNMDAATPILNQFVAQVAFSMQTSIFGIIFSVTLTLLNAMFPISALRSQIFKRLNQSIEGMWYRVHGHKSDPFQERLIEILEQIRDNQHKNTKKMGNKAA